MIKRLRNFILLSLLLHLLLTFAIHFLGGSFFIAKQPDAVVWVDLQKGQKEIVDILPPEKEERPKESKYVGLYDSRVTEEKVGVSQPVIQKRIGKMRGDGSGSVFRLPGGIHQVTKNHEPRARQDPSSGGVGLKSNTPEILEDYLPDFRRGPHTYLNVLRFPDIQYFVRLKRAFKLTFNPVPALRESFAQNRIAQGTVEAVLGVTIDSEGNLAELFVFKSSGMEPFDKETLRTVRASAPFAAPPAKLLGDDKLLRMSWTFTVYL